jgi:uncharacterized protein YndB with AHSA1/START domain
MSTVIGEPSVRRCTWIDAKPERVWEEFESLEAMQSWFGTGHKLVAYEPRVGALVETDAGGAELRFVGNVLVYDPPHELTFEQNWVGHGWPVPALITIRLTPSGAGTLVELFHHGFERFGSLTEAADIHRGFEGGWTNRQMDALRNRVQG